MTHMATRVARQMPSVSRADEAVARLRRCFARTSAMGLPLSTIADMAGVELVEVIQLRTAGMAGRAPIWAGFDRVCRTIEALPDPTDEGGE